MPEGGSSQRRARLLHPVASIWHPCPRPLRWSGCFSRKDVEVPGHCVPSWPGERPLSPWCVGVLSSGRPSNIREQLITKQLQLITGQLQSPSLGKVS